MNTNRDEVLNDILDQLHSLVKAQTEAAVQDLEKNIHDAIEGARESLKAKTVPADGDHRNHTAK